MYEDIRVLLVDGDSKSREDIDLALSRKRFQVVVADSLISALGHIEDVDILVLNDNWSNGNCKVLLNRWNKIPGSGPACVITSHLDEETVSEFLAGAWNVIPNEVDVDLLTYIVERYAHVIWGHRCCEKVPKLEKRQLYMWIAIAALGGTQVFMPLIQSLIQSLSSVP
jgi:DNA-binding NtrC family response regulator